VSNPLKQLRALIPAAPLLVGEVTSISAELRTVELPDGSKLTARGDAGIGDQVFIRGGVIEGAAPSLTAIEIVL
jgi:hypothetical protein